MPHPFPPRRPAVLTLRRSRVTKTYGLRSFSASGGSMAAHCFAHSRFGQSGSETSVAGTFSFPSADFVCRSEGEAATTASRSEEHTSELQSLMRNSYAVFGLKKKKQLHALYK